MKQNTRYIDKIRVQHTTITKQSANCVNNAKVKFSKCKMQ